MEPMNSSSRPQPRMVGKKSPPRSAVDTVPVAADSPLNGLFYPPSHVNAREQDLYAILSKGQNGSAHAGIADSKSQLNYTKSRTPYAKESKHSHDLCDTSIFGSSLHYGGRDYYDTSAPKEATGSNDFKVDKDLTTDSHGDWWQGSFYY